MKELDLAQEFKLIFSEYHQLKVTNKEQGGWPDRLLQLKNSHAVFCEHKMVNINLNQTFRIALRQEQAVWLAKWRMNGGDCFLFLGFNVRGFERSHGHLYGILHPVIWREWLEVPKTKYFIEDFVTFSDKTSVLLWFKNTFDSS